MDTTELHYVRYDEEETWHEMVKTYLDCGGQILYPGDEKEMLMRAVLAIATAIMAKVDSALRMDTLTYATGEYLKEYGQKRNCVYIDAIAATAPVEMEFYPTGIAQTIPAGTGLTVDGQIIYETTEDLEITGTAQTLQTTLQCQTPGAIGNGLHEGAQMQFIESVDGFVKCIVTETASGGVDEEDEEVYRERIRNYGLASVTTGPEQMYESQATAASSQIIDARAINDGAGEVGLYLILAEDAERESIFNSVEQRLSAITTRPLTDHVSIHEAAERNYNLNVEVYYSQYAGIGDDVTAAVEEYQSWQDNRIGRAWNPDKLMAMLYQVGCERVRFTGGSGMSGSVQYTEIEPSAHCKGTIRITVVNT
ncbi:MAG: baseplate J/gp47 family protein [Clostridia bacterium]|nr:baseplate J/gp47 family protein [Clostridia bacterium]